MGRSYLYVYLVQQSAYVYVLLLQSTQKQSQKRFLSRFCTSQWQKREKKMKKVTKKKEKAKKGRQVCSGDTIHLSFIGRGPPLRSIFFRNKCNDSNVQRHLLWVFYDAECSSRSFRLRQKNRKREKAAKMHLFALANKLLSMYLICQFSLLWLV